MTASASPRSAISSRVAMGKELEGDQSADDRRLGDAQRPAGGWARVRSSIIIDGPSIWPAGKPAAAAPDFSPAA